MLRLVEGLRLLSWLSRDEPEVCESLRFDARAFHASPAAASLPSSAHLPFGPAALVRPVARGGGGAGFRRVRPAGA